jgi:hypothetical protein
MGHYAVFTKTKFSSSMAETKFCQEGAHLLNTAFTREERASLYTSGNGIKWKGWGGGHVTDHVIKEHNREDRSWLLQDSWVRRGGSKVPKLMKRKRWFRIALSLSRTQ